jgi:molybdopterin-guanine dinucleotide biosynthesis protein B
MGAATDLGFTRDQHLYVRESGKPDLRCFETPAARAPQHEAERERRCYNAGMRIIGLAGWSGSGKTTLLIKVIPRIVARGLRVSTLKHAHHAFDIDQPGKDSHSHRMAGASEVLVGSSARWALVHELRGAAEPTLASLVQKLSPVDLVLVEGYKRERHPKLEIYRAALGKPPLYPEDPAIVAVASDEPLPQANVPVVDCDDIEGIADLLIARAAPLDCLFAHAE